MSLRKDNLYLWQDTQKGWQKINSKKIPRHTGNNLLKNKLTASCFYKFVARKYSSIFRPQILFLVWQRQYKGHGTMKSTSTREASRLSWYFETCLSYKYFFHIRLTLDQNEKYNKKTCLHIQFTHLFPAFHCTFYCVCRGFWPSLTKTLKCKLFVVSLILSKRFSS